MSKADVMVLAAGLGTRLRPLTDKTPKPLIPVAGRPMIEWNLEMVARSGFTRAIINLHHLGDAIRKHIGDGSRFGLQVEYSEEPELLDTGGGIKNIEERLNYDNLIVVNSDIILGPDFSLSELFRHHLALEPAVQATLLLRHDPASASYGEIKIDSEGYVAGFLGNEYRPGAVDTLMFSGVHILRRSCLSFMPPKGSKFSITRDTYPQILRSGALLGSTVYDGYWSDLGTPKRLEEASNEVRKVYGLC